MSGKTNKLANQEIRENYGDKSVQGATAILQGNNELDREDNKF